MTEELLALSQALEELGASMDMRVHRTTSTTQKRAVSTTTARREARHQDKAPTSTRKVSAVALEAAQRLAGGDLSRVKVQSDGSVVVING